MQAQLDNIWRYSTLYGRRLFVPGIVEADACGSLKSGPVAREIVAARNAPESLDENVLRLQLALDQKEKEKKEGKDITFVTENVHIVYPSINAPREKTLLFPTTEAGKDFTARLKMFEVAFQTHVIFTISVKPKTPSIYQLWYQKQILAPKPDELRFVESIDKHTKRETNVPETEGIAPPRQMGFLKPFETFSSGEYGADPVFDGIEGEWIHSVHDLPEALKDINDPFLKERLTSILTLFLEDPEADSVGLRFHENGRPLTRLIHKI